VLKREKAKEGADLSLTRSLPHPKNNTTQLPDSRARCMWGEATQENIWVSARIRFTVRVALDGWGEDREPRTEEEAKGAGALRHCGRRHRNGRHRNICETDNGDWWYQKKRFDPDLEIHYTNFLVFLTAKNAPQPSLNGWYKIQNEGK